MDAVEGGLPVPEPRRCLVSAESVNKAEAEASPSPVDTEGPTDQGGAFFSSFLDLTRPPQLGRDRLW